MARPLLLFAHGAGAPSSSGWMTRWASRLSRLGKVVSFDYPYMTEGRRRPDRMSVLLDAHEGALARARKGSRRPVVLIGKSMGGRMGCHLVLEPGARARAVVCLGYPLRSPGKRRALRDEVLLRSTLPILFVQGTRDRLCPLDELADVRARMTAPSALHVVESGDHSLLCTRTHLATHGVSQDDVEDAAVDAIARFFDDHL